MNYGGPTLLVLSPSTGGYYFGALLSGIAREVAAADGQIVLVQTLELGAASDVLGEAPPFTLPVDRDLVDGVISITTAVRADHLRRLQDRGLPVVVASTLLEGLAAPSVRPDNVGGTTAAVEHLIEHGHRRIGFVGNLAQADISARYEAYRRTLEAHGLTARDDDVFRAVDNAETGGASAAEAFLASDDRPTALMVGTDRNADGLLKHVTAAGIDVPRDLVVVSFDDIEVAAYTAPPLTTVNQSFDEVGALAARLVLRMIGGEDVPARPHTSPAAVVRRGSCGCGRSELAVLDQDGTGLDELRRHTAEQLRRPFADSGRDTDVRREIDAVMAEVERLTATDSAVDWADVDALTARIRRAVPHPPTLRRVLRALTEYVRHAAGDGGSGRLLHGLAHLQSGAFLAQGSAFEAQLEEQFTVDAALLDVTGTDPSELGWLAGTHVPAGVLATWDTDPSEGRLTIAGVYDRHGVLDVRVGQATTVTEFPGSLGLTADPARHQLVVVVPVRTRERPWGLLAVVGMIETTSARETYHHWAALLASSLEERALQHAVRSSEERYALASRAANEGQWELDLGAERIYVSDRCRELIGLDRSDDGDSTVAVADWTAAVHPDDQETVNQSLGTAMSLRGEPVEWEYRLRRPGGGHRWVLARCIGVAEGTAPVSRLVGSLSDIDDRKQLEEQLRQGALYDAVTGLPNRRLFLDRLDGVVATTRRRPGSAFAVVFLDLDGFKLVNDSLGHFMGDELLRVIAHRLQDDLRSVDTAARFGGDEFAVLLSDPDPDEVLVIVDRIQSRIAEPVLLGEHEVAVTASVGIATSGTGYTDAEDVLRDADIAMYDAKSTERGSASMFDPLMHAAARSRLQVRAELRAALAEQQFVVHYQPIVPLDGSTVAHFEALVRWQHPERGLLMPGAFLPAMEDNAAIVALGTWLIDEVCSQIARWRSVHDGAATVSVNLSHREFWSEDLIPTIRGALDRHHVPASGLVVEITESVIMTDLESAREILAALHELGVELHIDDFGTGQSSLNALRTLPVDALKIDGSFIREVADVERTEDLVATIFYMGRALGLDVIAECVETVEQAERLADLGCTTAQGWLYARAVPGDQAAKMLGAGLHPVGDGPRAPEQPVATG